MLYNMNDTTRVCKSCTRLRPISKFPLYNRERGYRRHVCGACWAEWHREYRRDAAAALRQAKADLATRMQVWL